MSYRVALRVLLLACSAMLCITATSPRHAQPPTLKGLFKSFGLPDANDVFLQNQYAYLATENNPGSGPEFYILDISNPAQPTFVSALNIGAEVNKVYVEYNTAYLATADNSKELVILDVTNKSAPVQIGSYDTSKSLDALAVYAVGGTAYLGTENNLGGGEFYVLDVTTPGAISLKGPPYEAQNSVLDIDVNGTTVYLATANANKEFMVLDASNPAAIPQPVFYNVPVVAQARGVRYFGGKLYGIAYANTLLNDFYVFDASVPDSLTLLGGLDLGTEVMGLAVYDSKAFVSTKGAFKGLKVLDVATASAPTLFASFNTASPTNGVAAKDSLAYVTTADNNKELQIIHPGSTLEPVLTEIITDGKIRISCLGDSNTSGIGGTGTPWPQVLQTLIPANMATINKAVPATTAIPFEPNLFGPDGFDQLADTLANDAPDAIVASFGSGDMAVVIAWNQQQGIPLSVEPAVQAFRDLKTIANTAGLPFFLTTTVRVFDNDPNAALRNELISQLNNRLRHEFSPTILIDFSGLTSFPADFISDGLHVNAQGHVKRAQEARRELAN